MAKLRVLLDMDEVLCDFMGGAAWLWGCTIRDIERYWPVGNWSMIPALSQYVYHDATYLTDVEFWKRITACGEKFWTGLKPHPWLDELVNGVRELTQDWYVVTSPSRCPTSLSGKARWLREHLPEAYDRGCYVPTRHKHLLANHHVVLVDDRAANVDAFRGAGGIGVVFPRHNNPLHPIKESAVRYTLETLTAIVRGMD